MTPVGKGCFKSVGIQVRCSTSMRRVSHEWSSSWGSDSDWASSGQGIAVGGSRPVIQREGRPFDRRRCSVLTVREFIIWSLGMPVAGSGRGATRRTEESGMLASVVVMGPI